MKTNNPLKIESTRWEWESVGKVSSRVCKLDYRKSMSRIMENSEWNLFHLRWDSEYVSENPLSLRVPKIKYSYVVWGIDSLWRVVREVLHRCGIYYIRSEVIKVWSIKWLWIWNYDKYSFENLRACTDEENQNNKSCWKAIDIQSIKIGVCWLSRVLQGGLRGNKRLRGVPRT